MAPSDLSIYRAFVRKDGIVDVGFPLDRIAKCFPRGISSGLVSRFGVGEELIEPISVIGTWNVAEECDPSG